MERYYQESIECAPREQIRAIQSEKLVKQVRHVWDNVPYYRKKMEEKGVTPDDIKSVDDLHKLPFLSKADLRDAYPYGLLGKPLADCLKILSWLKKWDSVVELDLQQTNLACSKKSLPF